MNYNLDYSPPAPYAHIILRNINTSESIKKVPMILDTGADITLLPKSMCEKIRVDILDKFVELKDFNQNISIANYVKLDFIFLSKAFRGNFLVYDQIEGIIGRDILNCFSINFDGINSSWKENK